MKDIQIAMARAINCKTVKDAMANLHRSRQILIAERSKEALAANKEAYKELLTTFAEAFADEEYCAAKALDH